MNEKNDEVSAFISETKISDDDMEDMLSADSDFPVVPQENKPSKDKSQLPAVSPSSSNSLEKDFESARENIKEVIAKTTDALDHLIELASDSESARCYEVVGQLAKVLIDANEKLMNVHKQRRDTSDSDLPDSDKQVTNNNLFVGSTQDLQSILSDMMGQKKGKRRGLEDEDMF